MNVINLIEQYPVLAGIAIFLLGIIVTTIGFFIQRRFFSKAPKQSFSPTIHVSPITQSDSLYAEVHNVGNDPLKNLSVVIEWLQDGTRQHRVINRFFNSEQNPVVTNSHNCTFLNANEKKKMASLPKYSDDGTIIFKVQGQGVNSGISVDESFTIQNEKK